MGIQDIGVFVSAVVTVRVYQSYNGGLWSPPQRACTENYMTSIIWPDRQERFDKKISKLKLLRKQRHLHFGCPWGKLKHTKSNFKVNYPFT